MMEKDFEFELFEILKKFDAKYQRISLEFQNMLNRCADKLIYEFDKRVNHPHLFEYKSTYINDYTKTISIKANKEYLKYDIPIEYEIDLTYDKNHIIILYFICEFDESGKSHLKELTEDQFLERIANFVYNHKE